MKKCPSIFATCSVFQSQNLQFVQFMFFHSVIHRRMQKMQKHRYNLNPISESIWFICSLNKADIRRSPPGDLQCNHTALDCFGRLWRVRSCETGLFLEAANNITPTKLALFSSQKLDCDYVQDARVFSTFPWLQDLIQCQMCHSLRFLPTVWYFFPLCLLPWKASPKNNCSAGMLE